MTSKRLIRLTPDRSPSIGSGCGCDQRDSAPEPGGRHSGKVRLKFHIRQSKLEREKRRKKKPTPLVTVLEKSLSYIEQYCKAAARALYYKTFFGCNKYRGVRGLIRMALIDTSTLV
jgi:hypothetical protein